MRAGALDSGSPTAAKCGRGHNIGSSCDWSSDGIS
jgi:hypothetical protein